MKKIQIFSDSCCDLDTKIRKDFGIEYLKMGISYDDKVFNASLDWDEYSVDDLYGTLRSGTRVFTAQVHADQIRERFTACLSAGMDVVYIAAPLALSASVEAARGVARALKTAFPDNEIYIVDSLSSTLGLGLLTVDAAKMRDKGKSAKEIAEYFEKNKYNLVHWTTVDDLQYLKRAGRVKASAAFFANVLNLKPVMTSDMNGMNFAYAKAKGRKKAMSMLIDHITAEVINPENQTVYISHADCYEDALFLKEEIMQKVKFRDCYINYMGPILGASAGPGSLGMFCMGKDRRKLFENETAKYS
ncbi:MAG: DegV family protein [Clostridiales bacterium]|jgi:DegV family protein with EDD domain|nr:DegV family protein [Clostridiales bacterium]